MGGPSPGVSLWPSSSRSSLQLPGAPPAYTEDGFFDAPGPSSDAIENAYPSRRWRSLDPRTSSTQSLAPSLTSQEQRRTLLLIYVHGFMGNDSSFRSFPAHIHQFLKESLAETHVIHTKIYPRYKTYKSIEVARDNFSLWLEPHESPTTDVVLIGHSMGGLLAADVALQRSQNGTYNGFSLRHRILGTVSLDAPLLGLHPGIVVSGIASLFRPAATPTADGNPGPANPGSEQSLPLSPDSSIYSEVAPPSDAPSPALTQTSSFQNQNPSTSDPFFNPSFFNDASFVDRGWLRNIAHFAKKHKEENLVGAAANHIMSHLEFGGCLADYPGLKSRYTRLRKLEDVDDLVPSANGQSAVRVRFVNYYTVSTGPLKKPKSELPPALLRPGDAGQKAPEKTSLDIASRPSSPTASTGATTPRISIEDYSDSGRPMVLEEIEPIPEPDELVLDEPTPTTHDESKVPSKAANSDTTVDTTEKGDDTSLMDEKSEHPPLPPIPDLPPPPPTVDLSIYTDKDSRKQAEKEGKRLQKVYDQAVKNRDKALKEREKLIEKRRRKAQKDAERQLKLDQKKKSKEEQDQLKKVKTQPEEGSTQEELEDYRRRRGEDLQEQELFHAMEKIDLKDEQRREKTKQKGDKKDIKDKDKGDKKDTRVKEKETKKLRKFCMLPGKINGAAVGQDPTWVQVYMEGVDEVGAHCGLFFPGPHYEKLVGDVGSRIVGWVLEDCSRRAVFDLD